MTHPKLRAVVVGLGVGAQHAAAYKSLPNLFDLVASRTAAATDRLASTT